MTSKKVRVQFDFTPESLKRVDEMQQKSGASTRAEVLRNALKVYEWFMQLDPEHKIEVRDQESNVVYRIPVRTLLS